MAPNRLTRLVVAVVVGATACGMSVGTSPAVAAESSRPVSAAGAELGVVAPLAHARPAPAPASGARVIRRGSRSARASSTAGADTVPQAGDPLAGTARTSFSVAANFDGTSSLDSETTNFGAEFEPPDQGLCVGNGYVLEPVNSAYRIFDTSGHTLAGPFNVNDLYAEGGTQFTSDPRCYYDATTNTWFAIILFIATNNAGFGTTSHLDVAVNPSGDPTSSWTEYQFDSTDSSNTGCGAKLGGCFADQPKLGIDQDNLYVSGDEYGITSNTYNGAEVFAFAKADLVAGRAVHFAFWRNLTNADGSVAGPLQPAITTGAANAEYFMDALDPAGRGDHRIGVWALTNGAAVGTGGTPALSRVIVASERYSNPPDAAQKGSTSLITNNVDDRMQQTQYINGTLWGELDTAINIRRDPLTRSAGAWFAVRPALSAGQISGAQLVGQGYVAQRGEYVMYPALEVDRAGNATMVFTLSGSNMYPSAAYSTHTPGAFGFSAPVVAASGTGPYDANGTRWGDYSWAVIDPVADAFWLATEYIPPAASQTTDGALNWGTRVVEVRAG